MSEPTPAEERAVDAVSLFDVAQGIFMSNVTREEIAYMVRIILGAGVNGVSMATVLEKHQLVVGPHGLTRYCTCGVDVLPIGDLVHHQAEELRKSIVGDS
jgi:hypothetical protein